MLIDIKDILLQNVSNTPLDVKALVLDQLALLIEKVNAPNIDAQERLMD